LRSRVLALAGAAVAASIAAVLGAGCRGGSAPEARPAAQPSGAGAGAIAVPFGLPLSDAGPPVPDGMPKVAVVLDDPRLATARALLDNKDEAGAAREIERILAAAPLDTRVACEWSYLAGRLHLSAGESNEAAADFLNVDTVADSGAPCALAPYARLRAAEALVRASRFDDAVRSAQSVSDDIAARDEARLALADALSCKGDRAAAVGMWRTFLTANPHGFRWVDISMQLATALLDGVDGPPASTVKEALERLTRVIVEAPVAADKLDTATLLQRAKTAARAAKVSVPPLTPEERARQAQAWLDGSQQKKAREAAEQLLASVPKGDGPHHAAACSAAIVRAQATPHGKSEDAASAWGSAIARCEKEDPLVTALYYGAKASASAHRHAEALDRFEKVEKLFPAHRLADDARFRSAMLVEDLGDPARAVEMLSSIPDAYPQGDMGGEALFRVALEKLDKRDLDGARAALDRVLLLAPETPVARRADYFRARVAELSGDLDDAKRRYAALISAAPLDYYMLLAYSRLRAQDDTFARATLESAVDREPQGPFIARDHPELASMAFDRFVSLLEVGEVDAARREASTAGFVGDGADTEVLWAIAWLFDRAGAPELGHSFARGRLAEYRTHWPSGRWKIAWEVAFPRAWDALVTRESDTTRIPSPLTWAVMREESAFNPDAKSVASAIGLMQLMAGTARLVARDAQLPFDEQALHRPDVSIALGTRLLSELRTSFPLHPAFAIAAYNGGSNAVRRWLMQRGGDDFDVFVEHIPFDETRAYVKKVLSSEAAYAYLYAPAALDEILAMPAHLVAPTTVATP
jgi:soluble lytic murein transglycosylase